MWVENAFGLSLREPGGFAFPRSPAAFVFGNTVVKRKSVKIIQRMQKTAEAVSGSLE